MEGKKARGQYGGLEREYAEEIEIEEGD